MCLFCLAMKRSAEDGEEEEGIEEPDGKRLRLEIAEGENGQHIIQQVQEIEVQFTIIVLEFGIKV